LIVFHRHPFLDFSARDTIIILAKAPGSRFRVTRVGTRSPLDKKPGLAISEAAFASGIC
jgi:hypothetical protein